MARVICARCGTETFTTDPPHLCKDIAKRLNRRQRQKEAVIKVLQEYRVDLVIPPQDGNYTIDDLADAIVKKIVGMLAEDD